jgi:hypothetical protein
MLTKPAKQPTVPTKGEIKMKMKKVTEKNLRVNDIIYKQENASELFEVEAQYQGCIVLSTQVFHSQLC